MAKVLVLEDREQKPFCPPRVEEHLAEAWAGFSTMLLLTSPEGVYFLDSPSNEVPAAVCKIEKSTGHGDGTRGNQIWFSYQMEVGEGVGVLHFKYPERFWQNRFHEVTDFASFASRFADSCDGYEWGRGGRIFRPTDDQLKKLIVAVDPECAIRLGLV